MKKIVVIISILISLTAAGQVRYSFLSGECSISFGTDYCGNIIGNATAFNTRFPSELSTAGYNILNVYFAYGEDFEYTNVRVLDTYSVILATTLWKIGFSAGILYLGKQFSISATPYYYEVYSSSYDSTHNRIGWEEIGVPVCPEKQGLGLSVQLNTYFFGFLGLKLSTDFSRGEYSFMVGVVMDYLKFFM